MADIRDLKVSRKDLDLIIGSLRQRVVTMRTLWCDKGGEMPERKDSPKVLSDLEDLLAWCESVKRVWEREV